MRVAITGANRGIGLELCRQFAERGDTVVAICRKPSEALQALGVEIVSGIDVADDESVASLTEKLGDAAIDVLVNNAGILRYQSLDSIDWAGIRAQFEVNTLGPLRVTRALLDRLQDGSRVLIVTSRMGSLADNTSGGSYGYRMSKAAVNMAGVSLARDLEPKGIAVGLLHPGYVRTEMTGNNGFIDADESARGLIARIDGLSIENTGTFWHANGEVLPW